MKPILSKLSSDLQPILTHVRAIQAIQATILPLLPEHLRASVQVANWRKGTLVLMTTQALATELRFLQQDLLTQFRTEGKVANLRKIEILVAEPEGPQVKSKLLPNVNPEICSQISDMASDLTSPDLQAALKRLAKTLGND